MPLFEQEKQSVPSNLLKDRFGWPPFSVLNTMSFDWQRRKDEWELVIEDSTVGRDTRRYNATPINMFSSHANTTKKPESISSFDPYLTELMYRWFSLAGDKILDPFAGGNVRGTVASILGRHYCGFDLSAEQVDANNSQYDRLLSKYTNVSGSAYWVNADADEIDSHLQDNSFDMILTCPPYYNLEIYSKDKRDLSRQPTYEQFLDKYSRILQKAVRCLKDDSFLVIIVSELRADAHNVENSQYVGFVPDTINILRNECSLSYYNDIILMNNLGSLPMRAPRIFDRCRKVGRHHQNVLVFYKGNLGNIESKFGKISAQ